MKFPISDEIFNKIKNNILIFEQKMFYYKLNYFTKILFGKVQKELKVKIFLSPQWLEILKEENILNGE